LITVKTRYYAYLRELTGIREEEIVLNDGATVGTLIEHLIQKYGDRFKSYILADNMELKPSIAIAINGVKVSDEPLKRILRDGDTLVILPPISGGVIV
jgi:molybdopterin synthase catalytic subunit/molybdopterin synthase sulfur carrier subunit